MRCSGVQYRCIFLLVLCILTRPAGSSKYCRTRKNIQRYCTPKHPIRYMYFIILCNLMIQFLLHTLYKNLSRFCKILLRSCWIPQENSTRLRKILHLLNLSIEILDLECVLCHVIGVQNENKNALINPPCWICPRSVVCKRSWGELNFPL